jgi:outer membrane usher protein
VIRGRLGAIAVLAALSAAAAASASERRLALEVVMNGHPTGRVGEFIDRDGKLFATPADLSELGFALPRDLAAGTKPIPLASLPNLNVEVNEADQTLMVQASDDALVPTEVSDEISSVHLAPLSRPGYGAVFNYDLTGTYSGQRTAGIGQQPTGGALLDLRAFGPYGVLENTSLVNITPYAGQASTVRLGTTFDYADPDGLRRWRAGDVVTGALSWSRAVRLGGAQVSSDFALRPDLVTYPLPVISASAALPSTVDVVVDGIRQFNEPVQPGPFVVRTLPVVTGAGEIAVTVQDALGRQTLVTLPFYASATLLKPGLASYSLEAGTVRENFGLTNDRYAGSAASGSLRYGVTDWLTVEDHAEATDTLVLLGGGAAMRLGSFGVFNAAASGSSIHGVVPAGAGGNSGGQLSAGFQRVTRGLSFSVSGSYAIAGYSDIAALYGAPMPRSTLNASLGYQLGKWGSVGLGYVNQVAKAGQAAQTGQAGSLEAAAADSLVTNQQVSLATLSYSIPIGPTASFYATGFKDLHDAHSYGVAFGISLALGPSVSASAGASLDSGRVGSLLSLVKPALAENDYGYRLLDSEGAGAQHLAQGEFLTAWGRAAGGVAQSSGQRAVQGGWNGALVWTDGHLFGANRIDDSFAVVSTGGVAGVPVLYENRLVGETDSSGHLLVPSLLSYQNNQVAVDATRLPADVDVGQTSAVVRPPDRAGVVIDFSIKKANAALLTLVDGAGKPVPVGSVAKIAGTLDQPVGFDGLAYVIGLQPSNRVQVVLPDGTGCSVQFDYTPVPGDIPLIGPLRCQ